MVNKTPFSPASEKGHCDGLVDEGKYLRQSSLYKQILPRTPSRSKTSVSSLPLQAVGRGVISVAKNLCNLWLKNPFNQRNPRLMNYLRAFGISTTVVSALQIHLFMQNEPNFRKSQMNVNKVLTKDYEKRTLGQRGKNEPKTNPIYPVVASGEAGTNPIYRGVASGEAGSNPTCSELACPERSRRACPACPERSQRERSRRSRTYFKGVGCIFYRLVFSGESNKITHTLLSVVSERFQVLNGQYYNRRAL